MQKLLAIKDEFMEDGTQFCTEGKEYAILPNHPEDIPGMIQVIDDKEKLHFFATYVNSSAYYGNWFKLIEEDE